MLLPGVPSERNESRVDANLVACKQSTCPSGEGVAFCVEPASVVLAKTCSVWARDLARERLVADESSQRSTMKLSRA
ncbi:hypothetical protein PF010_g16513 [Phytophthora fragariae]|uniref:Uncharacterized protein n=1 Tax=Phytophthora fragariae TaxID=53985 RepID=A0A6G0KQS7_9STRA|nr:hypothetical protein PF010_g16513 [Phytophthora fragariae]